MTEEKGQDDVQIASPLPVILSGLINGAIFCGVYYLAIKNDPENAQNKVALLNIGFLLSTIVIAQIFFRRSIITKVTLTKLLVAGWFASLFFALTLAIFYKKFFPTIGAEAPPIWYVLMMTGSFGLVISAIVAFFISRKK